MDVSDAVRQLRKQLGLTQEQLGERLGVSGRVVRRWEGRVHHPDPKFMTGLAALASDAKEPVLAHIFRSALIRDLGLVEREALHAHFDTPTQKVVDEARRFKFHEPAGPPRGMLLLVRHGAEETRYLNAVTAAFLGLRSSDEAIRKRSRAALEALCTAMQIV
jgi:transcriptional regulator with XRE-family HTH domain